MSVLREIVERARGGTDPAILGDAALTYAELASRVEALAARLMANGVGHGQLAITALPQGVDNIVAMLAVRLSGAVVVPTSPVATDTELNYIVENSGAATIIVAKGHPRAGVGEAVDNLVMVRTGVARVFSPEPTDELVVYTSGSTGRPKGVILGSDAFAENLRAVSRVLALGPSDRTLAFTPPQYTLALSQVFSHLQAGGGVLPVARGMLDPLGTLAAAAAEQITGLQLNPGMLRTLMQTLGPDFPELPLRYVLLLGQPVSISFVEVVQRQFPEAEIFNGYGCTENSPRVAMGRITAETGQAEPLDVGAAVPGTEISIRDEQGWELARGMRGEICIRGASLMRGYLNAEKDTADRLVDGWFRTRDLGELDEQGRLRIAGRVDNVILVSHEKVSPEDIEEEILKVPGVQEAAVAGVSDPQYFQVPAAVIVAEDDAVIADIRRVLRTALSRSRQPARYWLVDAVPRTPYGKIDRAALRRMVAELDGEGSKDR